MACVQEQALAWIALRPREGLERQEQGLEWTLHHRCPRLRPA